VNDVTKFATANIPQKVGIT